MNCRINREHFIECFIVWMLMTCSIKIERSLSGLSIFHKMPWKVDETKKNSCLIWQLPFGFVQSLKTSISSIQRSLNLPITIEVHYFRLLFSTISSDSLAAVSFTTSQNDNRNEWRIIIPPKWEQWTSFIRMMRLIVWVCGYWIISALHLPLSFGFHFIKPGKFILKKCVLCTWFGFCSYF